MFLRVSNLIVSHEKFRGREGEISKSFSDWAMSRSPRSLAIAISFLFSNLAVNYCPRRELLSAVVWIIVGSGRYLDLVAKQHFCSILILSFFFYKKDIRKYFADIVYPNKTHFRIFYDLKNFLGCRYPNLPINWGNVLFHLISHEKINIFTAFCELSHCNLHCKARLDNSPQSLPKNIKHG